MILATHRPLGSATDAYAWVSETTIAPWVIYVLGADERDEPEAGRRG
jgi:hypothetical protein